MTWTSSNFLFHLVLAVMSNESAGYPFIAPWRINPAITLREASTCCMLRSGRVLAGFIFPSWHRHRLVLLRPRLAHVSASAGSRSKGWHPDVCTTEATTTLL